METIKQEKDDGKKKKLWKERNNLIKNRGINQNAFVDDVSKLQKHFAKHIAQKVGAYAARNHVWSAFNKVVFGNGKKFHFTNKESAEKNLPFCFFSAILPLY